MHIYLYELSEKTQFALILYTMYKITFWSHFWSDVHVHNVT